MGCLRPATRRGPNCSSTWKCFTTASVVIPLWGSYPRLNMNGRTNRNAVNFVSTFRGEDQCILRVSELPDQIAADEQLVVPLAVVEGAAGGVTGEIPSHFRPHEEVRDRRVVQ